MRNITDIIAEVCEQNHVPMVQSVFGDLGVEAVFQVMAIAKKLYQHVEPERICGQVVIYQVIHSDVADVPPSVGTTVDMSSLANQDINDLILEVGSDGLVHQSSLEERTLEELAENAIVYHYQNGHEKFMAKDQNKTVIRLDYSSKSQFSVPTFSCLRDALRCYALENVRESTCYIFRNVWHDPNRLFLKAGPETEMRNSLVQYLRNRLSGDHNVWPEQVVDESHPVDIRVAPRLINNRLMLIEIKWLGDSVATDGHITAQHRNARAQSGADQLVQYLRDQLQSAPSHIVQGYYVIIDARRRNLREGATTISHANGMYYETKELSFDPAPHDSRQDFDPPYRMFARPICND